MNQCSKYSLYNLVFSKRVLQNFSLVRSFHQVCSKEWPNEQDNKWLSDIPSLGVNETTHSEPMLKMSYFNIKKKDKRTKCYGLSITKWSPTVKPFSSVRKDTEEQFRGNYISILVPRSDWKKRIFKQQHVKYKAESILFITNCHANGVRWWLQTRHACIPFLQ